MTRGSEPGYRRQRKLYRLTFEDHPGLVVRARSASMEMFLEVTRLQNQRITLDIAEQLFKNFASVLVSWNLEDEDGTEVPATYEGMMGEDWEFINTIINGWMEAVVGVSAPLETPSQDGRPSPEESLPMEISSPSLAS